MHRFCFLHFTRCNSVWRHSLEHAPEQSRRRLPDQGACRWVRKSCYPAARLLPGWAAGVTGDAPVSPPSGQ